MPISVSRVATVPGNYTYSESSKKSSSPVTPGKAWGRRSGRIQYFPCHLSFCSVLQLHSTCSSSQCSDVTKWLVCVVRLWDMQIAGMQVGGQTKWVKTITFLITKNVLCCQNPNTYRPLLMHQISLKEPAIKKNNIKKKHALEIFHID